MSLKQKVFVAFGLTACIFVCSLFWNANRSGVRSVVVRGNALVSTQEILQTASLHDSLSINDALDLFATEQTLKKHPFIKDATLSIGANDKLFVTIVERKPVALIKEIIASGSEKQVMYFVDADTVAIPYRTETRQIDVPIVYIYNRSTDIPAVITIVQVLQESAQDVLQRILAVHRDTRGEYVLEADNNCTILIGAIERKESLAQKVSALRAVLNIESNALGSAFVNDQVVRERIKRHGVVADIRFDRRIVMTDKK